MMHVTFPRGGTLTIRSVPLRDIHLVSHVLTRQILRGFPSSESESGEDTVPGKSPFFAATRVGSELSFACDSRVSFPLLSLKHAGDRGAQKVSPKGKGNHEEKDETERKDETEGKDRQTELEKRFKENSERVFGGDAGASLGEDQEMVVGFVSEGELGLEETGLISRVSSLFTGMPIFYHSTVQTDYFFVKASRLAEAVKTMRSADAVSFSIEGRPTLSGGRAVDLDCDSGENGDNRMVDPDSNIGREDGGIGDAMVTVLPYEVSLYSMEGFHVRACAYSILSALFHGDFPDPSHGTDLLTHVPVANNTTECDRNGDNGSDYGGDEIHSGVERFGPIASFAETPDEVSLLLDDITASRFPAGALRTSGGSWCVFSLSMAGEGGVQADIPRKASGFVNAVARAFEAVEVPMLYLSTASRGVALVPKTERDRATAALEDHGIKVVVSHS